MLYDTHMHTPLCQHARGLPIDYARAAAGRGLTGIIVTCHNPMPDGYSPTTRMRGEEMPAYREMVQDAREAMRGRIDVRIGLECDYLPEFEPWLERQLAEGAFDYVLGSVHPHLSDYKQRYPRQSSIQFQQQYFDLLVQAAETGLFDTLAHPDLVKKVEAEQWDPAAILDHVKRCLDRIAATNTAMELNTGGRNSAAVAECYPGPAMLREMCEREIPVVIGSDAHDPHRVAADFPHAIEVLRDAGYTHTTVILGGERHRVSIDDDWRRCLNPDDESAGSAAPSRRA